MSILDKRINRVKNTIVGLKIGQIIALILFTLTLTGCYEDRLSNSDLPNHEEESIADWEPIERASDGNNIQIPGIDYENLVVKDSELKMASGPYYSLFIDDNKDLYYLGDDPLIDMFGIDFLSSGEPSPMKITGLSEVRSVTAGIDSFYIILENGDLYFMEADRYTGKLITNNENPIPVPEKVNGVSKVKAVAAGYWHTLILLENGDLYTYGFNDMGQLGLGTLTDYHSPEKVEGLNEVAAISAGAHHSLALLGNGDLYTFGYNNSGQLGLGDREDRFTPELVDTLSGAVAISAGDYHSLVLLANGDVYSFGEGSSGQLGHGDNKKYLLPARVEDLSGITAISAGDVYSLALSEQGIIYLFGYTYQNGQSIASPAIIAGLENVTTVTAGFYHFLATTKSKDLYQLGLITPDKLSTSPELIEFINKGKIANLPVLEDNLNNNPTTISGYWQGIVNYHEYNHAQVLLHFSEEGIFTAAFPQSGYLCLFNYFYAEEKLYIYNPFFDQWQGPVMLIEDDGEMITFPNEQLKDLPDQELQGFGLFYPVEQNTYRDLTGGMVIHDFTK